MIGALMMRLSIARKLPLRKDSLGERVVMELCLGDGSFGLNSLCTRRSIFFLFLSYVEFIRSLAACSGKLDSLPPGVVNS